MVHCAHILSEINNFINANGDCASVSCTKNGDRKMFSLHCTYAARLLIYTFVSYAKSTFVDAVCTALQLVVLVVFDVVQLYMNLYALPMYLAAFVESVNLKMYNIQNEFEGT